MMRTHLHSMPHVTSPAERDVEAAGTNWWEIVGFLGLASWFLALILVWFY